MLVGWRLGIMYVRIGSQFNLTPSCPRSLCEPNVLFANKDELATASGPVTPSDIKMATNTQTETSVKDATELMLQRAEAAHTKPLWLQMARLNPPLPNPKCTPFLWRYADIRPNLLEAGELVPEHQAERRVLMLINPSRGRQHTCFVCIETKG